MSGYQPIHAMEIKHPPGNSGYWCGTCDALLNADDVQAYWQGERNFTCANCECVFTNETSWNTLVSWITTGWEYINKAVYGSWWNLISDRAKQDLPSASDEVEPYIPLPERDGYYLEVPCEDAS